jgi:hypothetical protein
VQNGVNPQRLINLTLSKDLARIAQFETIEANNPDFDEPTLGMLCEGTLLLCGECASSPDSLTAPH